MYKKFLFHTVLLYKKYIRLYKITKFNNSYMYILTKFEVKYNAMKIPETFRIKRSSCVHRAFIVRSPFTLRSSLRSVRVQRSLIGQGSHIVHQLAFSFQTSFTLRSLSVRSACVHRSLTVRSSFAHRSSGKVERFRG